MGAIACLIVDTLQKKKHIPYTLMQFHLQRSKSPNVLLYMAYISQRTTEKR